MSSPKMIIAEGFSVSVDTLNDDQKVIAISMYLKNKQYVSYISLEQLQQELLPHLQKIIKEHQIESFTQILVEKIPALGKEIN